MFDEPTQDEIDGVAKVFAEVVNDPIAANSAYIMAKKLKRVFLASNQMLCQLEAGFKEASLRVAGEAVSVVRDAARRNPNFLR
jgi:hypothetical protein